MSGTGGGRPLRPELERGFDPRVDSRGSERENQMFTSFFDFAIPGNNLDRLRKTVVIWSRYSEKNMFPPVGNGS